MANPVLILFLYKASAEINRAVHEAKVLLGARDLLCGDSTWYTFSCPCSTNVMHPAGVLHPVQSFWGSSEVEGSEQEVFI